MYAHQFVVKSDLGVVSTMLVHQEWEKKVKDLKNQVSQKESKLKTVGKEGYYRLAAEVETYKVRQRPYLIIERWIMGRLK